jgi:hypothetical protein
VFDPELQDRDAAGRVAQDIQLDQPAAQNNAVFFAAVFLAAVFVAQWRA